MIRFLLDTNTINEPLKASPNANVLLRLQQDRAECGLASISWHEMRFGCLRLPLSHRRTVIEAYLNQLVENAIPILPYNAIAADWHAAERSRLATLGKTPPFADGQIAAVAAVNGLTLVTRNVADFALFQGLVIENWFEPTP
jgi:tRNA(fMet)-specific endonuclease VapC